MVKRSSGLYAVVFSSSIISSFSVPLVKTFTVILGRISFEFIGFGIMINSGTSPCRNPPPIPSSVFCSYSLSVWSATMRLFASGRLNFLESLDQINRLTPAPRLSVSKSNSGKPGTYKTSDTRVKLESGRKVLS